MLVYLYLLLFFALPLSIENTSLGFGISLPSEILQLAIAAILLYRWKDIHIVLLQYYRHPLLIGVGAYIIWGWATVPFAEDIANSAKYTVIETLHVLVFVIGFIYTAHFKKQLPQLLLGSYLLSLIPLLIRGWYMASKLDFVISFSLAALWPFYNDHTLYGACIAMLLPFCLYYTFKSNSGQPLFGFTALLLAVGLFLSFSRAAWLSFIFAGVVTLLFYLLRNKPSSAIKFVSVFITLSCCAVFLFFNVSQRPEFVKNTTLQNQFLSSFNWSYDVANLERLNKFKCCWRMIQSRPFIGFGNNGFKYNYTQFQKPEEMTRISLSDANVLARKGTGGNSHSEYLEMFVDLGLPGFIVWCSIVIGSVYFSLKEFLIYRNSFCLFVFFALSTFFIHGLVNSFLHEEKIAAFVWLCIASIPLAQGERTKKFQVLDECP